MYQVSFNSLLYFQRHAPDKLFIAKIKEGSNSITTGDRVMVLAFCSFLHGPQSVYHFIYSQILLEICSGLKCDGQMDGKINGRTVRWTDKAATICSPFGEHKNI